MESPAFTACPTLASTLHTLPGTEAVTFTLPAPAAALGAAFGAALGAAFGAALGAAAGAAAPVPVPSSTVTSYAVQFTVIVYVFILIPPVSLRLCAICCYWIF